MNFELGFIGSIFLGMAGIIIALWGAKFARITASITFGLALGYALAIHSGSLVKASIGSLGLFLLGFAAGFATGFSAFKLVAALLAGLWLSDLALELGFISSNWEVLVLTSAAFTTVVHTLMEKLLALGFALLGAGMLYFTLRSYIQVEYSLLAALVLFIIGLMKQWKR
ncbi:MAG: hypothetical protein QXY49_06020 [Thermofilaceae archaeon]